MGGSYYLITSKNTVECSILSIHLYKFTAILKLWYLNCICSGCEQQYKLEKHNG